MNTTKTVLIFFGIILITSNNFIVLKFQEIASSQSQNRTRGVAPPPIKRIITSTRITAPECTQKELDRIKEQLPRTHCKFSPFLQRCSFTKATKCPQASWIKNYYFRYFDASPSTSFVGINVGCSKGYEAIDRMRMGSYNKAFDKGQWKKTLGENMAKGTICGLESEPQFDLSNVDWRPHQQEQQEHSEMHCIEPMPITYDVVRSASKKLGWDKRGFVVTKAAISKEEGVMQFPVATGRGRKSSTESKEIVSCQGRNVNDGACEDVVMMTLDSYVDKYVKADGPIDMLFIDVEGYDFDVLLGGNRTLNRTRYIEFEYNWMGSWKEQKLSDAVKLLDEFGFTCYWAGVDRLWRITSCWLEHYDYPNWANVACAHFSVLQLLDDMEELFMATVASDFNASLLE